jgi:hypothetical protein
LLTQNQRDTEPRRKQREELTNKQARRRRDDWREEQGRRWKRRRDDGREEQGRRRKRRREDGREEQELTARKREKPGERKAWSENPALELVTYKLNFVLFLPKQHILSPCQDLEQKIKNHILPMYFPLIPSIFGAKKASS